MVSGQFQYYELQAWTNLCFSLFVSHCIVEVASISDVDDMLFFFKPIKLILAKITLMNRFKALAALQPPLYTLLVLY